MYFINLNISIRWDVFLDSFLNPAPCFMLELWRVTTGALTPQLGQDSTSDSRIRHPNVESHRACRFPISHQAVFQLTLYWDGIRESEVDWAVAALTNIVSVTQEVTPIAMLSTSGDSLLLTLSIIISLTELYERGRLSRAVICPGPFRGSLLW